MEGSDNIVCEVNLTSRSVNNFIIKYHLSDVSLNSVGGKYRHFS